MEDTTVVMTEGTEPEEQEEYTEQPEDQAANEGGEEVEAEATEEQPAPQDGGDQLKANERIQQEIGRRKAEEERARQLEQRLQELETRFTQQKEPDYIPMTPQTIAQVNQTLANIEQARVEAELEGDYLKAAQHRQQFDQILRGLAENQQRMQQAQMSQQQRAAEAAKVKAVNERAEFFRQANNIPPEQWQMANQWFADQVAKNPALGVQFREMVDMQGPMAAVQWAVNYVDQNLAAEVRKANETKVEAKTKLPGGTTQQNTGQHLNQMKNLKAQAMQSGSTDDWAAYYAAKRQTQSTSR